MDLTLRELAVSIRSGEVSSEYVAKRCLDEVHRTADALNCFTHVDADGALARARELDRELANGQVHGPLHGVPLAHKDMFYRAGRISACGSRIRSDFRPTVTSTLLSRLDAAGAIDLGQLHMAEFALSPTGYNMHLGQCHNPWRRGYITGGSSSGSGAAVGARLVYGALGSDTGGSVRIPSAVCGITGLKPTQYLLSTYGAMPLSPSQDCMGFLAQSAEDCAILLDAVCGPDPADPACISRGHGSYLSSLSPNPATTLRVAVPYFDDSEHVTEEIAAIVADAGTTMGSCGCEVKRAGAPAMDVLNAMSTLVFGTEAGSLHADWLRTRPLDYAPQVRRRIVRGLFYPGIAYIDALRLRPLLLKEFLESHFAEADALILPVLPRAVPTLEETTAGSQQDIDQLIGSLSYWTRGINYLGLPSLALPAGFTDNGLPVGVQLVGRPFAEATILRIGHSFQQVTDMHRRRPEISQQPVD